MHGIGKIQNHPALYRSMFEAVENLVNRRRLQFDSHSLGRKQFFFEKKNQKNFWMLGCAPGVMLRPMNESLLFLFFKEDVLSLTGQTGASATT
jgi:hypothetical protein